MSVHLFFGIAWSVLHFVTWTPCLAAGWSILMYNDNVLQPQAQACSAAWHDGTRFRCRTDGDLASRVCVPQPLILDVGLLLRVP